MTEEVKRVTLPVDGRTLTMRAPDPEQVVAWMGLAGSLTAESIEERDQDEVTEDVTMIMDAILGLFETDEDRRWFRRATVLGKAKLSDALGALMPVAEEESPKPKPKVRRSSGR